MSKHLKLPSPVPLTVYTEYVFYWFQFNAPLKEWTVNALWKIIKHGMKTLFWMIFLDIIMHFFYVNAIMYDDKLVWHIPLWSLAGMGFGCIQFFMVQVCLWPIFTYHCTRVGQEQILFQNFLKLPPSFENSFRFCNISCLSLQKEMGEGGCLGQKLGTLLFLFLLPVSVSNPFEVTYQ